VSGFLFKLLPPLVVVMNCLGLCGHNDKLTGSKGVWIDDKPAALLESAYTKYVKWVGFSSVGKGVSALK